MRKELVTLVATTFTRPADTTAYAAGDLIANSTTAGSVVPLSFKVPLVGESAKIVGVRLTKSDQTDVANSAIDFWFFTASPTVANGDNGALSADLVTAGYLGQMACPTMLAGTDDAIGIDFLGEADQIRFNPMRNQVIYALLEATAAYSPASAETFTATIFVEIER